MAGISPNDAVVYHIFSENPKVSETYILLLVLQDLVFLKEIGKTDVNKVPVSHELS